MKLFENKRREVVVERKCFQMVCDLCGKKAEHPEDGLFEWGAIGTSSGKLEWQFTIDGECKCSELDFCWDCAERIAKAVCNKTLFQNTEQKNDG